MITVTIDTYKTIQKLETKGFSVDQAEGIFDALTESKLVTKQDLRLSVSDLKVWVTFMLLAQAVLIVTFQTLLGG